MSKKHERLTNESKNHFPTVDDGCVPISLGLEQLGLIKV